MSSARNSWLLTLFVIGIVGFMYILSENVSIASPTISITISKPANNIVLPPEIKNSTRDFPVGLIIPKIGVDAEIESVGVNREGVMIAPKGPDNVGWLNINPIPGQAGNAVIDGHRGWKDHIRAVFDRLHELQIGDHIYVIDAKGYSRTFVVRDTKIFDPREDASSVFGTTTGVHLNLITCDGDWNFGTKSYATRLVVFASLEM